MAVRFETRPGLGTIACYNAHATSRQFRAATVQNLPVKYYKSSRRYRLLRCMAALQFTAPAQQSASMALPAPRACDQYALDIPVSAVRAKIRENFRMNLNVTDTKVIDMLVVKGQMELDEVHNFWKQKTHVMRYWKDDANDPTKMDFLTRFYKGHN